jgi:DNA-binding MarR family transcriptional regulator
VGLKFVPLKSSNEDVTLSKDYLELTRLIERLHRRYLDVLRTELKRAGVRDLNGVQALLLANIGDEEIAIRDLVERGYYQGSNVSYNIRKLTDLGYLDQQRAAHDKRSVLVKLTDKGSEVVKLVGSSEARNAEAFTQKLSNDTGLRDACDNLQKLERMWADYIRYGER